MVFFVPCPKLSIFFEEPGLMWQAIKIADNCCCLVSLTWSCTICLLIIYLSSLILLRRFQIPSPVLLPVRTWKNSPEHHWEYGQGPEQMWLHARMAILQMQMCLHMFVIAYIQSRINTGCCGCPLVHSWAQWRSFWDLHMAKIDDCSVGPAFPLSELAAARRSVENHKRETPTS